MSEGLSVPDRRQSIRDEINGGPLVAERRGYFSPVEGVKVFGDSIVVLLRSGEGCSICDDLSAGDLMSVFISRQHFLLKVVDHRSGLREADDGLHVVIGERVEGGRDA